MIYTLFVLFGAGVILFYWLDQLMPGNEYITWLWSVFVGVMLLIGASYFDRQKMKIHKFVCVGLVIVLVFLV